MKQLKDKLGKQGDKPGDKLGDKQGNKPGQQNRKPGQEGDDGSEMSGGDSEQMARIAAQQAALRKQLNDLNNQLRKDGKSNPNLTRIQNDMDRNETDIVNRRITGELLQRQSQILSRLLEAKDALRQQEQGEERESRSAKDLNHEIPDQLKNILRNQQSVLDYYKTVPAELKPYYRQLVEQYFQLIR